MKIQILALERLIEESKQKIANTEKQLRSFNEGVTKLSPVKQASLENALEDASKDYDKYKKMYSEIPEAEIFRHKETERVQKALAKQTYYKLQKMRLKRAKSLKRNQLLEAMMMIDELPDEVNYDDTEIISMSDVIIKYNMREIDVLEKEFKVIKDDFNKRIESLPDEKDLKHFLFLDSYIPIIVLHFSVLVQNIIESIDEYNTAIDKDKRKNKDKDKNKNKDKEKDKKKNKDKDKKKKKNNKEELEKKKFSGLPKYEDWWIEELFKNHQAYFGLYKWKDIVSNICLTQQQRSIWDIIFNNWLMIKKILNGKGENAYDYNYIFDKLIAKYVQLEEELDENNLKSMESIVFNITAREDFTKTRETHNIKNTYFQWKKAKNKK